MADMTKTSDFSDVLHYKTPGAGFTGSLPLGNGRIGAAVYGGIVNEKISLNEDTLWTGYPKNDAAPDVSAVYTEIKQLVRERRYLEAEHLFEDNLTRSNSDNFLPLGDMEIAFNHSGEVSGYQRRLELDRAVAAVSYTADGALFEREYFVSQPDDALVIRLKCSRPGGLGFRISLKSRLRSNAYTAGGDAFYLDGECPSAPVCFETDGQGKQIAVSRMHYSNDPAKRGVQFRAGVKVVLKGGGVPGSEHEISTRDHICVENADEAVIYFKVLTSFNGCDRHPFTDGKPYYNEVCAELEEIAKKDFDAIKERHIADFSGFYGRVKLDLGGSQQGSLPTDERLDAFADSKNDNGLYALLFNYGRYLMISGSRPGTQPLNLQGIWNDVYFAPWRSNYTTNINTEMNYWPAEITNLTEMHLPLMKMVEEIARSGRDTAKFIYGGEGACAHHNCDLWRKTTPPGRGGRKICMWAFWPFSAGWLCRHLWEHYEYSGDMTFLKEKVYPASMEFCRFFLSTMEQTEDGLAFIGGTSPEHQIIFEGEEVSLTLYTTMSNAIIRELFENTAKCCDVLGEGSTAEMLRETAAKVVPYKIGSRGELLEYDLEYEDRDPHHRHISHLYGLHPGHEINMQDTPELAQAVKRSLEIRGDDGTGWSLGWKINQWARLLDGDHALGMVDMQLRPVESSTGTNYSGGGGSYSNLLDAHPPFQIDGNFGATAGIAEMFLQSRENKVFLLPALPSRLPQGSVTGLCAKGGLVIDIYWSDGKLERAVIKPSRDCEAIVVYGGLERKFSFKKGEAVEIN